MGDPIIFEKSQGREQVFESGTRNRYPVEQGSTGSNLSNFGLSHVGDSTDAIYVLDPPEPGVRKYLACTQASTNALQTVRAATGGSIDLGSANAIVFDAADQGAVLMGRSSTRWDICSLDSTRVTT